jgi:hypothetical protein
MDFVNSMFAYWQGGIRTAERGARDTQRTTAETPTPPAPERDASEAQRTSTEAPPERQAGAELPLEDHDSLNIQQISERLDDLSSTLAITLRSRASL